MKTIRNTPFRALALLLALPILVWMTGCDVGSVDSTSAILSDNSGTIYNYSGLYLNIRSDTNGVEGLVPLVFPNQGNHKPSGELINTLRLLQYGSVLEGYDSAGLTWYGNISTIGEGGTANFTMRGRTTVGNPVEMAGTLIYATDGDGNNSTLNATWIEPTYYGNIYGNASVAPAATNAPVAGLTLVANPPSLSNGGTSTLIASGGSSVYEWPSSLSFGRIVVSTVNGQALYTRSSGSPSDSESITVTSGSEAASVTISFN